VFLGMPNMILEMMDHPDYGKRDVSSLRTGITIATPELMKRTAVFGVREVCQVYGMTESYGVATLSDCKAPEALRCETVGRLLPGQEVVVADPETHAPLPVGEVGEFKLKGHVTPGYYKEPERNAESYDAEGYLLSGDLGWQDEQGYFHYTGRHKDMIKTGGINVAPAEVEQFLLTQPGVSDASVIAVPDPLRDEAVAAVIVPQAGAQLDAKALAQACKAHLAAYKVPRHFRFMQREELPLTATGKVRKVELREMMAAWMAEQEGATKQHGV
jgi:fatty-acyl-CoA synthase